MTMFSADPYRMIDQNTRIISKDGTKMVDVVEVDGSNALVVTFDAAIDAVKISQFGEATVASTATSTLTSYTVPASKKFIWTGVIIGGTGAGVFEIQIDAANSAIIRNTGSDRTKNIIFSTPLELSAAEVAGIKVENIENKTKDYEATLLGYITGA